MIGFFDEDYALGDLELGTIEEAYVGKSKDLLKLEKMIGENRKKYYGQFKVGGSYYTDKDFIKIGDLIADIFNFKVVDFNLVNDPAPNAFTIPAGYSMDYNINGMMSTMDKKKQVFKSKKLSTVIRVTSGMWTNKNFTDGEITAIIVHEVGHNFQQEVNDGIKGYTYGMFFGRFFRLIMACCSFVAAPLAIYNFIMGDSTTRAEMNKMAKENGFGSIIATFGNLMGFIRVLIYEIAEIFGRATFGLPAGIISLGSILISTGGDPISMLIDVAVAPIGKSQENISDVFASEHGYGPELVSVLTKASLDPETSPTAVGRICKKLPLFDSLCTLFGLPTVLISQLFASHPVTGKRASNIVYELEKDLERSDVSPAMKKEIKKQIQDVKDVVEEYTKVNSPLEGQALRKAIFRFTANYDRDPKGFVQKVFSKKDFEESVMGIDDEDIEMSLIMDDGFGFL